MPPPSLTIQLFGPLRICIGGEPMPRLRTRSVEWLLALLVLRHGRAVDRSWLAGTLWPDSDESRALHNLRDALVHLRKALGPERARLQSPTRDTLRFDLTGAEVDIVRFDAAMKAGDEASLRSAVELSTRSLLEGCLEAWLLPEREHREQACLAALETLAEIAEQRGDHAAALRLLRRAEALDNLRDSLQRRLLRVLAASGDAPAALLAYREYRLRLHHELNVEPDADTARLFQQIRAHSKGGGTSSGSSYREGKPSTAPILGTDAATPDPLSVAPLPHPITALIGREQDVQEVVAQVAASRLVTLAGAGGVGKTRLAIEAAREAADGFPAGAAFVALASLSDPALLPAFVATALARREEGATGSSALLEALMAWLAAHPVLLVLDNCEHLIEAAAALCQTLLERCPRLHILATSRQRLGLTGEVVWRVPSLPSPDPQHLPLDAERSAATVIQYPAAQLFVERARMVKPTFRLSGQDDTAAVAQICQRLDGIPLALELAAARVGFLTLPQIASRLGERFRLLTSGSRGVLTRHRTLRALIDWSYDLLTEPERSLLCGLSVCVDGWTLEAAEALFAPEGERALAADPFELLVSLTDKSLVLAEARNGELRYRMLETVREYSLEKLRTGGVEGAITHLASIRGPGPGRFGRAAAGGGDRTPGDEAAARHRHLSYYLSLAEAIAPEWSSSDPEAALARVEREIRNFQVALTWAQTSDAPDDASLRLAAALWPYWEMRGSLSDGREFLRLAAQRSTSSDRPERAQVLLGVATLAFVQSEPETALTFGRESLALFRHLNDPRGLAAALILCGHASLESNAIPDAASLLEEALECCRRCDWARGSALALTHLGLVAMRQGEPARARSLLEQGLARAAAAGHAPTLALSLHNRGYLAQHTEDYPAASALLERSLEIWRRLGNRHKTALTLRHLGQIARQQGDLERSRAYFEEAVAACREQGNLNHLAIVLCELGSVLYEQSAYERARPAYAESVDLFTQADSGSLSGWVAGASNNLGSTLFHLGDHAGAQALHREALSLYDRDQSAEGITWSLERLAVAEARHSDARRAALLMGAAATAREGLGIPLDRWDRADWDQAVAALRAALGPEAFAAAWAEGRAMPRDEVVTCAARGGPGWIAPPYCRPIGPRSDAL